MPNMNRNETVVQDKVVVEDVVSEVSALLAWWFLGKNYKSTVAGPVDDIITKLVDGRSTLTHAEILLKVYHIYGRISALSDLSRNPFFKRLFEVFSKEMRSLFETYNSILKLVLYHNGDVLDKDLKTDYYLSGIDTDGARFRYLCPFPVELATSLGPDNNEGEFSTLFKGLNAKYNDFINLKRVVKKNRDNTAVIGNAEYFGNVVKSTVKDGCIGDMVSTIQVYNESKLIYDTFKVYKEGLYFGGLKSNGQAKDNEHSGNVKENESGENNRLKSIKEVYDATVVHGPSWTGKDGKVHYNFLPSLLYLDIILLNGVDKILCDWVNAVSVYTGTVYQPLSDR